jgi:D-alanyl-D-alanine carboxypeptidase/D-alanyl-D-alanine-endopeptidase (penicillin-binding protein 4)
VTFRWLPVVLVLAVLAGAFASYRFDLGDRLGVAEPDPATDPAAVAPPEGLVLPELAEPAAVARPLDPRDVRAEPAAVRRALARPLRDRDLGREVLAAVAGLGQDGTLFTSGGATAGMPASTTKLLTTTAALSALGPDHTFRTRVVRAGRHGVVLVGGGDPFLASTPDPDAYPHVADVTTLARSTAERLRRDGVRRVRVRYDDTLFSGPAFNPHWPASYLPDAVVSPITALWVDEGRSASGYGRVADPSATAATTFAGALARAGIRVLGPPRAGRAPQGAREIAGVDSPPLAQVVERILLVSDNEAAEVVGHHVGLASGDQGSFTGGVRGVVRELRRLGVDLAGARLYDGSGLSRDNRLAPTTLVGVLQAAASRAHPDLRAVVTGLPVAGFSGSLADRFDGAAPQARGHVRAKTGTLTGVSALAGVATDVDGDPLVFALVADRVRLRDTLDARDALDDAATALGACRCAG